MTTRLYGILWRWHFLAGLVACPLLLVVAITGGLYVFQHELEHAADPALFEVAPGPERRGVDELLGALPAGCRPGWITVDPLPGKTLEVWCEGEPSRRAFVDPYRGDYLGAQVWDGSFFGVVLELHWELMLGERGRIAVEWATSWCLLLMLSGAYLWWPRGRKGGAWWPRRGVVGRQRLRDLHALAGAYALPVLLAIAATGLFWTTLAGEDRWKPIATDVVQATWAKPPTSTVVAGAPRIGYDAAIAAAGVDLAREERAVGMTIPAAKDGAYQLYVSESHHGSPWKNEIVYVDAYSGAVLRRLGWDDRSTLGKVHESGYAIHTGAILGIPGKIAATLAALLLAALCVTGPWMWWKRRPRGGLGVPPPARRTPWPLFLALAALGWLLPTVGWTLVAVGAFEAGAWAWRHGLRRVLKVDFK